MITLTGHYSEEVIIEMIQNALMAEYDKHIFQMLNPRLEVDGNQWCCIWGELPTKYIAGFGDTPAKAISAFISDYFSHTLKP